jgi:hypothetical protein
VKVDPDGEYQWPGDLDVFNEAMRQRKLSKLVTKNKADDSSGDATDLVTGRPARTVGTSEDPQNYFLGKQLEKFPGLDIENAWRSHPISEDAAITVMNAETFVEACTYRTFGTKVYYLPYVFGRLTTRKVRDLYDRLYRATKDDDTTPIEQAYEDEREKDLDDRDYRFYVSAVMPHQLESNNRQLHAVSTGWYFYQTFAERDDDEADADDPRIKALVSVLSGEPIAVDVLLEEYVDRIETELHRTFQVDRPE